MVDLGYQICMAKCRQRIPISIVVFKNLGFFSRNTYLLITMPAIRCDFFRISEGNSQRIYSKTVDFFLSGKWKISGDLQRSTPKYIDNEILKPHLSVFDVSYLLSNLIFHRRTTQRHFSIISLIFLLLPSEAIFEKN